MALLIGLSSFSFLAHFNPDIAARFNNAMGYFGAAILSSEAADIIRIKTEKIAHLEEDIKLKKSTIKRKNIALREAAKVLENSSLVLRIRKHALLRSSEALYESSRALKKGGTELAAKTALLNDHESRLSKFRERGNVLGNRTKKRFAKVAIYDAAGEFVGWLPVLGDAASIGMTAQGFYEMCQMFKEIEQATTELGVQYQVYTDTFCEKPVEKSAEVISDITKRVQTRAGEYASTLVYKITHVF